MSAHDAYRWAVNAGLPVISPEMDDRIRVDRIQKHRRIERTDPIIDTTCKEEPDDAT